jgi:hypothetical protein
MTKNEMKPKPESIKDQMSKHHPMCAFAYETRSKRHGEWNCICNLAEQYDASLPRPNPISTEAAKKREPISEERVFDVLIEARDLNCPSYMKGVMAPEDRVILERQAKAIANHFTAPSDSVGKLNDKDSNG